MGSITTSSPTFFLFFKIYLFLNFALRAAICQLLFLPPAAGRDGALQKEHLGFVLKYLSVQAAAERHNTLCHTQIAPAGTTCGQLLHPGNKSGKELRDTNA